MYIKKNPSGWQPARDFDDIRVHLPIFVLIRSSIVRTNLPASLLIIWQQYNLMN